MSIQSIGFTPWETLPANTMFRVTLASDMPFRIFATFAEAARGIYQKMFAVTGVIPSTTLQLVNSDSAAVIDGIVHHDITGADLLNRMESLNTLEAVVSRIERLSQGDAAESTSDDGARARAATLEQQNAANKAADWWTQFTGHFGDLTTFIKYGGIIVGVAAVAYLAHEFHSSRK
jgi:hypothetical protein